VDSNLFAYYILKNNFGARGFEGQILARFVQAKYERLGHASTDNLLGMGDVG
jgi:sulfur transfer complex TusBCD TusB component (DsrH family)